MNAQKLLSAFKTPTYGLKETLRLRAIALVESPGSELVFDKILDILQDGVVPKRIIVPKPPRALYPIFSPPVPKAVELPPPVPAPLLMQKSDTLASNG